MVTAAPGGSAPRDRPPLGPLTAARAQSPHRARRYMHRRGPVLGHCRPGPPRVTPASAHCPPRGSPHVSQRDTRDVDAGVEVGEGGVGVQIRPRAAGDARPAGLVGHAVPRSRCRSPPPAPLDGVRLAPVTCGAAPQRGPPGCSPVPGEASLVREATVGRRCPERSKGGLSAGTIQVPAGRGDGGGPAARRGMRAAGPRKPGLAPPRGRLGSRDQQVRHASVRRSMRRGVSGSPPRRPRVVP